MVSSPPNQDEIEISLFGPGYGECIIIHLGIDCWVVIDSCINPKTKKPIAVEYLNNLNVDLKNVKLIVATHWHDDHVRGISDVVLNCPEAEFVISEAIVQDEFIKFLSVYFQSTMISSCSGTNELKNVISYLSESGRIPKRAISDRKIWVHPSGNEEIRCEIFSLSPSDEAILLSNIQIASLIPFLKEEKRRVPEIRPNYTSVVLWVNINGKKLLLGSDLENSSSKDIGWEAIVNSKYKPNGKAIVYKVAHHGSENGHNDLLWESMIEDATYAILTPFKNGNVRLPRFKDIKKLIKQCRNSYITSTLKDKKPKTDPFIDKIMNASVKNRKLVNNEFGQIRLRSKINSVPENWRLDLFGDARRLF
jgi:hypothetical protein